MLDARFLVCPSTWYESFGLIIVEAFATGLPVIASDLGALAELIQVGVTGLLFRPGDAGDLMVKVRWALDHPDRLRANGRARPGAIRKPVYRRAELRPADVDLRFGAAAARQARPFLCNCHGAAVNNQVTVAKRPEIQLLLAAVRPKVMATAEAAV